MLTFDSANDTDVVQAVRKCGLTKMIQETESWLFVGAKSQRPMLHNSILIDTSLAYGYCIFSILKRCTDNDSRVGFPALNKFQQELSYYTQVQPSQP